MVKLKNSNLLDSKYKPNAIIDNTPKNICSLYPDGTTQGVYCQVQNFPRIVVLAEPYGYKKVLELNPANILGPTNKPSGNPCCTEPPFSPDEQLPPYKKSYLELKETTARGFNPNPPYIPPPEIQKECYNIRSALNTCNVNKRNFYPNIWPYNTAVYP